MDIQAKTLLRQRKLEDTDNKSVPGREEPATDLSAVSSAASTNEPDNAQAADGGGCRGCGAPIGSAASERSNRSKQLQKAISRWENDGGADGDQTLGSSKSSEVQTEVNLTNAEMVQLQIRMIALENLVIALLATATDQTPDLARAMATYISPRPGFTPHHLTIHAAAQMVHLVERSILFQFEPDS